MRLIISFLIICGVLVMAFSSHKCEHIFVSVEQAEIKMQSAQYAIGHVLTTGKQEGPELVCVKCFHTQRQILDYGESKYIGSLGAGTLTSKDTLKLFGCDTCNSRILLLKADTLQWSK